MGEHIHTNDKNEDRLYEFIRSAFKEFKEDLDIITNTVTSVQVLQAEERRSRIALEEKIATEKKNIDDKIQKCFDVARDSSEDAKKHADAGDKRMILIFKNFALTGLLTGILMFFKDNIISSILKLSK